MAATSSATQAFRAVTVQDTSQKVEAVGINLGRTFVFLKPDTFEKNIFGQVISEFEQAGIKIVAVKQLTLTKAEAESFYAIHKDQRFYASLVDYVTRGPILAMVLKVEDAVTVVRSLIGATNPTQADKSTIRGKYGTSLDNNVIHGSDSPENAAIETAFFFSSRELLG